MSTFQVVIIVIAVVIFIAALVLIPWIIRTYNILVMGRNKVTELWSNIEVMLNRRHELVPNLVSTVKGYAKHEEGVLTQVTEARAEAVATKSPKELSQKEAQLSMGLSSLYAVAENYPELKANDNFMRLQQELVQVEDTIQRRRNRYNKGVSRFNTFVQQFPQNLIAGMLGFKAFEFFDAPDEAEKPVEAGF